MADLVLTILAGITALAMFAYALHRASKEDPS